MPNAEQIGTEAPAASPSDVLVIEAGPGERGVFTAASLREYPQTKVTVFDHHAKKNVTYAGRAADGVCWRIWACRTGRI